jgi:hypothetical protein
MCNCKLWVVMAEVIAIDPTKHLFEARLSAAMVHRHAHVDGFDQTTRGGS